MKKLFVPLLFLLTLFFTSCSDKIMGYSVVLWTLPEQQIKSGDIVPVYIKSNISHVYVIGNQQGEKIEVALWQLTDPVKKGKIKNVAARYADNAATYASVKLDGLPCRAEPVNTAKQVYRLRKGEIIKIPQKDDAIYCSFCGRPNTQVVKMVKGPGVNICSECTMIAVQYLILNDRMPSAEAQAILDAFWGKCR